MAIKKSNAAMPPLMSEMLDDEEALQQKEQKEE